MFEQSMLCPGGTRKRWLVALVILGQLIAVGVVILIPMLYLQVLPAPELTSILVAPPPPSPPSPAPAPPAAATHAAARTPKLVLRRFDAHRLIVPRTVPKQVATVQDLPQPEPAAGVVGGVPGGVAGGQADGVLGGVLGAVPSVAPPPPPPQSPPPKVVAEDQPNSAPQRIRVGGNVEEAQLMNAPKPVYPRLAAMAEVQGVVTLDAVIGTDGRIKSLKLVSGSPLLAEAAMDAVKQWVYRPTYLNGRAVEVATEVDVHFQLS